MLVRFFLSSLCALTLLACQFTPREKPWIENGQRLGTIETVRTAAGFEVLHFDDADRLIRVEKLDRKRSLREGPAVETFAYGPEDRPTRIAYQDANGVLTPTLHGYAVEEIRSLVGADGERIDEHRYLDELERPVHVLEGYAAKRVHYDGDRIRSVQLFDTGGRPVEASFLDVHGTAEVEYAYLQGVGEVVYGVFRNRRGDVLDKRRLSGEVRVEVRRGGGYGGGGYYGGAWGSYTSPPSGGGFKGPVAAPSPPPRPAPKVSVPIQR